MNTSATASATGSGEAAAAAPEAALSASTSGSAIPALQPEPEPEAATDEPVHTAGHHHSTPVERLLALLHLEASDLWVITVYAIALGILSLATPIAVQAMVNQVAFGQLLQPLVILMVVLLVFLGLSGLLRTLQTATVEVLQQRLLVRAGLALARRLPQVPTSVLRQHGPDLASRFF